MKPAHIVETCLVHEVEPTLERLEPEYDLHAMSSHQVGSGFGAYVQVLLLFRLRARPTPEMNGKPNGNSRAKMIAAIPPKK
jgi:hypothetical protein